MEFRSSIRRETHTEKIASIISELRTSYKLSILLQISGMSRSTYYYTLSKVNIDDKNKEVINKIVSVFNEHSGKYGYRRVTEELRAQGYVINHKKVKRIMKELNLYGKVPKRQRYSSYKGTQGKIAEDHINRNFKADLPTQKWYTDVTEFNLRGTKLYLSPIIDGFNGEVISYNLSLTPNLKQTKDMLQKALSKYDSLKDLILHSDQGWQYQHKWYQKILKENKIIQSMSRKGNSLDNGMMESFFSRLKVEMFYGEESKFKTINDLIIAIQEYIEYYNNKRIKSILKGLSPVQYRNQVLENLNIN